MFCRLCLILFICVGGAQADVKLSVASDLHTTTLCEKTSHAIEQSGIEITTNCSSDIFSDEAALYALKNGMIQFSIVRQSLFAEIGLDKDLPQSYGFVFLREENGFVIVVQKRYFDSLSRSRREQLYEQLRR